MSVNSIVPSEDEFQRGTLTYVNDMAVMEVADDYEFLDTSIEYTIESILHEPPPSWCDNEFKQLKELSNNVFTRVCNCTKSKCSEQKNCHHGGNYEIAPNLSGRKELVLNTKRVCTDLIYECGQYCKCPSTCWNRLLQYGPRKHLRIENVARLDGQCGLTTTSSIPRGGFICEYAGEVITKSEAIRRSLNNEATCKMNYIICLNESSIDDDEQCLQTFIDPSAKGNVGRYLNHSCDPNCEILSVRIDVPVPRLGIFAIRDILPLEELCFHYGGGRKGQSNPDAKSVQCRCGAENCELYLPNIEY